VIRVTDAGVQDLSRQILVPELPDRAIVWWTFRRHSWPTRPLPHLPLVMLAGRSNLARSHLTSCRPFGVKVMRAFLRKLPIALASRPHARVQLPSSVPRTRGTPPISTTKRQDNETLRKKSSGIYKDSVNNGGQVLRKTST